MVFKVGQVYRDLGSGAYFIIALERQNPDTHDMCFRMINTTNWIMLREHHGKQLASGDIHCPDLKDDQFELAAATVREFYTK